MKNPVIVQFESDPFYKAALDLILFQAGIQLGPVANDIKSTKSILSKIKSGALKPDVAIVDTQIQNNHFEGEKIAKRIREFSPKTKVVAYSIMDDIEWADYVAIKSNLDQERTIITALSSALNTEIVKSVPESAP